MPLYLHRETRVVTASKPYSSKTSFSENASPDSTTDGTVVSQPAPKSPLPSSSSLTGGQTDGSITNVFPKVQIESIEETMKDTELTPDQLTNYCKKLFVFKELEVAKFKTWK